MIGSPSTTNNATYELRVRGLLGPLLLSALPHVAARQQPRHTVLVTDCGNGRELVDVVRVIIETGLDVVSVRCVPGSE